MYVDGFLLAVSKDKLEDYKQMSREAGAIWKEYGALTYVECISDDVPYGKLTSFPRAVQATDEEIVVFSWITYPSREVRDAANKKVMEDPADEGVGRQADAVRRQADDLRRLHAVPRALGLFEHEVEARPAHAALAAVRHHERRHDEWIALEIFVVGEVELGRQLLVAARA